MGDKISFLFMIAIRTPMFSTYIKKYIQYAPYDYNIVSSLPFNMLHKIISVLISELCSFFWVTSYRLPNFVTFYMVSSSHHKHKPEFYPFFFL